MKPSRIVRFIAIWLIIALSLFTFLPNVEKHWKGVGICITIGFLVSLFIRLLQYRKITERNIREAPGFNSLGPVEKGERFFKKLNAPKHHIANFLSTFILFLLIGFSTLPDYGNINDVLLCIAFAAIVAFALAFTKFLIFKRWRKHHDDWKK